MYAETHSFGMVMPGRHFNEDNNRYGFHGMEKDDEISGSGNSYTTEFRQYDPRLGRWKSIDPLAGKYPNQSPYAAFNNNPIYFNDPLGLEGEPVTETEEVTITGTDKSVKLHPKPVPLPSGVESITLNRKEALNNMGFEFGYINPQSSSGYVGLDYANNGQRIYSMSGSEVYWKPYWIPHSDNDGSPKTDGSGTPLGTLIYMKGIPIRRNISNSATFLFNNSGGGNNTRVRRPGGDPAINAGNAPYFIGQNDASFNYNPVNVPGWSLRSSITDAATITVGAVIRANLPNGAAPVLPQDSQNITVKMNIRITYIMGDLNAGDLDWIKTTLRGSYGSGVNIEFRSVTFSDGVINPLDNTGNRHTLSGGNQFQIEFYNGNGTRGIETTIFR